MRRLSFLLLGGLTILGCAGDDAPGAKPDASSAPRPDAGAPLDAGRALDAGRPPPDTAVEPPTRADASLAEVRPRCEQDVIRYSETRTPDGGLTALCCTELGLCSLDTDCCVVPTGPYVHTACLGGFCGLIGL